ncbi:MAG: arsenate reductase [Planctomycetota bacterium]|jgi:arsenate reductase
MTSEKLVIYHNPSCSKSRETLKILEDHHQDLEIIEYLKEPPSREALKNIIHMLGVSPRELIRDTEQAYKDAELDNESLSDDALIDALCKYPKLLQRPIVVSGNKAVIGRPPVNVLDIIV